MNLFVFIANAWGPVSGGINCFNYDLVIACARAKRNDKSTKICCVIPDLDEDGKQMMEKEKIIPVTLSKAAFDSEEAIQLISDKLKQQNKLRHYYPGHCNTFFIGHDIYTGEKSKLLAEKCAGWNVVFHHMAYKSYYLFMKPEPDKYTDKVNSQQAILCNANLICAVGPMLFQSAEDIVSISPDIDIEEVVPGLAEFEVIEKSPNWFTPIVFGRVEKDNQRIKQITLAVDAYAKAISMDQETPVIGRNSTLNVIGYDNSNEDEFKQEVIRIQENASEIAGTLCNVVLRPYITDREDLGKMLRTASVAMMLSFHEGFGLVGYEAISAGVPLILSKNTGLYMFLQKEGLAHLVYSVDIEGSMNPKGYSERDLDTVAKALRTICQNEEQYKKMALELCRELRSKKNEYSWESVANNFMCRVLNQFEAELKYESTVFYQPEELTKIDVGQEICEKISFEPSGENRVFSVEGKYALAALYFCLREKFADEYSIYVYNVQNEEENDFQDIGDFLSDCRTFFGRDKDHKVPDFKYILSERLDGDILILDNLSTNYIPVYNDLFTLLDEQEYNFYIFTVLETDSPVKIEPYSQRDVSTIEVAADTAENVSVNLTDEQKLLIKVLSFRDRMGYRKSLIRYICNSINWYYNAENKSPVFDNIAQIEEDLINDGFVEKYSKYIYHNSNICLTLAPELKVEDERYALGIAQLGRFYARCYHLSRDRDPQLYLGYFSCKCFAYAAGLNRKIKKDIKSDYEAILLAVRKKAVETSDYGRYIHTLQQFIDEYKEPDDLWIWYNLLHCQSIYCPQKVTLKKIQEILDSKFSEAETKDYNEAELKIQFIRLCAELECDLNISDALQHLIARMDALPSDSKRGTAWTQCLSTAVNLAIDQKEYDIARQFLDEYMKSTKTDDMYMKVISAALKASIEIAQYYEGVQCDLSVTIINVKKAYYIAKNNLKDYRAQGWTLGLMGECQILMEDGKGEQNLRNSMKHRQSSGEKTKEYRNWLKRIAKHKLRKSTKKLLNEEIVRVGA